MYVIISIFTFGLNSPIYNTLEKKNYDLIIFNCMLYYNSLVRVMI